MTTTKIDPKGGVTRYLQLYAALSQELADGVIDPGAVMPSEPSLVRKYRVSRTTVRRALARLESEGKIVRRRGSGTFATARHEGPLKPGERVSQLYSQTDSMLPGVTIRTLDATPVETPAAVLKVMQNFGVSALMVRSLRLLHGQPFAIATSYFGHSAGAGRRQPASAQGPSAQSGSAQDEPGQDRLAQAVNPALIERAARKVVEQTASGEQIVAAVSADAFSARQLGVAAGVPLLQVRRLLYDAAGKPLEYQDVRYRADLFELRMLMTPDGRGGVAMAEAGVTR